VAKNSLERSLIDLRIRLAPNLPREVTDADLLTRFLTNRDDAAFAALVRRHSGMVFSVCRRTLRNQHDVEDAFQATFLTLAEKGAAIRKRSAVGSWLHGAAFRIASDLRDRLARRRAAPLPDDVEAPCSAQAQAQLWYEIHTVLDQELAKLPERYRAPLVLCYLEGRTRDEAAGQLGWSVGVVRGRLERGRQLLRAGLCRRGVALPTAMLATGLTEIGASASPSYLLVSTIDAARKINGATGLATSGLSGSMIELVNRGKSVMFWTKKKLFLLSLLVLSLSGGAILLWQASATSPATAWAEEQLLQDLPAEATVELGGRVLTPDGKPAAGARIGVLTWEKSSFGDGAPRTTSAADGTFKLSVPRTELALHLSARNTGVDLIATADGFGLGWKRVAAFLSKEELKGLQSQSLQGLLNLFRSGDEPVIRLVADDAPLSGQIKTEDGQPAVGARVELESLWGNDKGDLAPWLAAVGRGDSFEKATWGLLDPYFLTGHGLARFAATTDGEGRFHLAGIGRGRLVRLKLSGPNVAYTTILARTAKGEKLNVNGLTRMALCSPNPQGCFGTEIVLTAPASRPVEGEVTDAESGKPVAGAVVQSHRFAGFDMLQLDDLTAQTNAVGHFRLDGMPVGQDNLLLVRFPSDQPYVPVVVEVDTSAGKGPVKTAIKVRKGVWVEGRVTDAKTGRPLAATIDVFCPKTNSNLARYPNHTMISTGMLYKTDGSGRFRVPAIPGRAAIAAKLRGTGPEFGERDTVQAGKAYQPLSNGMEIEGFSEGERSKVWYMNVQPHPIEPRQYHQIRSLQIPASAQSVPCDLTIP